MEVERRENDKRIDLLFLEMKSMVSVLIRYALFFRDLKSSAHTFPDSRISNHETIPPSTVLRSLRRSTNFVNKPPQTSEIAKTSAICIRKGDSSPKFGGQVIGKRSSRVLSKPSRNAKQNLTLLFKWTRHVRYRKRRHRSTTCRPSTSITFAYTIMNTEHALAQNRPYPRFHAEQCARQHATDAGKD